MSEVLKQPAVLGSPEVGLKGASLKSYVPAVIAFAGAGALTLLRLKVGPEHFSTDGALMMLALAAYLIAATFYLMNLYAQSSLFEKIGLASATVGVNTNRNHLGFGDRFKKVVADFGGEPFESKQARKIEVKA